MSDAESSSPRDEEAREAEKIREPDPAESLPTSGLDTEQRLASDAEITTEQVERKKRIFHYRAYAFGAYLLLILMAIIAQLVAILCMQLVEFWVSPVPVVRFTPTLAISMKGQGIPVTDFLSSMATMLIAERLYRLIREGPPEVRRKPKN